MNNRFRDMPKNLTFVLTLSFLSPLTIFASETNPLITPIDVYTDSEYSDLLRSYFPLDFVYKRFLTNWNNKARFSLFERFDPRINESDVEFLKSLGFNTLKKNSSIEVPSDFASKRWTIEVYQYLINLGIPSQEINPQMLRIGLMYLTREIASLNEDGGREYSSGSSRPNIPMALFSPPSSIIRMALEWSKYCYDLNEIELVSRLIMPIYPLNFNQENQYRVRTLIHKIAGFGLKTSNTKFISTLSRVFFDRLEDRIAEQRRVRLKDDFALAEVIEAANLVLDNYESSFIRSVWNLAEPLRVSTFLDNPKDLILLGFALEDKSKQDLLLNVLNAKMHGRQEPYEQEIKASLYKILSRKWNDSFRSYIDELLKKGDILNSLLTWEGGLRTTVQIRLLLLPKAPLQDSAKSSGANKIESTNLQSEEKRIPGSCQALFK